MLSVFSPSTPLQVFMGPSVTRPRGGLSHRLEGSDPNGCNSRPGLLSRDLEFEIMGDYTHPSPFPAKKNSEICLIPLSGAASECVQGRLASITRWKKKRKKKKKIEHTGPGGALAAAGGEEGQLAGEQEVLGLIGRGVGGRKEGLRATLLGRRSQRSAGTTLAEASWKRGSGCRGRVGGAGTSLLTFGSETQSPKCRGAA